jgi:PAS domain S-box-containing protein
MADLTGHLSTVDRASLFDALERAATRVGLALFVVHVNANPPTVIYASGLLAEFVGRARAELVGRPPWELVAPALHDHVREIIANRGPGAPPLTVQTEIVRPDGTQRTVEVGVARVTTNDAELGLCYFRDTTDEQTAASSLRKSEERFRSLIEHAPDGIVIIQDGRLMLANQAAAGLLGVSDAAAVRGRPLAEFLLPTDDSRLKDRMAQIHAGTALEWSEYQMPHGPLVEVHSVTYEYDDRPAILTFVRDVTERRRMQAQIIRNDRLAALGTMAATVAHEINNPLTYLQLNLQRLEQTATPDGREYLASAMHGVERIARIVRDLRTYSRDNSETPEMPVDVVATVDKALQMVDHDLRHRAELVRRYPDEPVIVDGSEGRLEQVFVNVLVNAIQALEGAKNRITIEIVAGADVRITITDTGPGIAHPDRVFEPFYTTKPIGEGTGLGLAVCKQLVERMRGRIEIERTGKDGTTIAITLPRREPLLPAQPIRPCVDGTRLRILVIDDESHVRNVVRDTLAIEHAVDVAADGESALAAIAANDFDVILCDLMMPHMNGREVYERIRERWPGRERRVVFVTGGAFVPSLAGFLESIDNLTLFKPFTIEQVLALVREATARDNRRAEGASA